MARFSTWINNYRSQTDVSDIKHKEQRQKFDTKDLNYEDKEKLAARQFIDGAILK